MISAVAAPVETPTRTSPLRPGEIEATCAGCGGWVATVPVGTPWVRGRCGNRQVAGVPGRRCARYGKPTTFTFEAPTQ